MKNGQNETNPSRLMEVRSILEEVKNERLKCQEDYSIAVITHMMGGSSRPGQVDKSMPIRSSAIRGHLRFWWRATRGARFQNASELFAQESRIFGSSTVPSSVKIWVDGKAVYPQKTAVEKESRSKLVPPLKEVSYAAFPFQEVKANQTYMHVDKPYWFTLHVHYSEHGSEEALSLNELKEEVHTALWAWVNFGGIGARSRRGFGSLYCASFAAKLNSDANRTQLFAWLNRELSRREVRLGVEREWPTLGHIIVGEKPQTHRKAWEQSLNSYREFRRKANKNGQGRSQWPEADSIRHLTGMSIRSHINPYPCGKTMKVAFPRATLGMPIVFAFHSKDKREMNNRDPFTTQLIPVGANRLASPIITKSLAINQNAGVSMVVQLIQPKLEKLKLDIIDEYSNSLQVKKVKEKLDQVVITADHIYPDQMYKKNPLNVGTESNKVINHAVEAFLELEGVKQWGERF